MCLSKLVGIYQFINRRFPRRHAPNHQKRPERVMPSRNPRVFEVIPVRLGNTDYFFYHVRNMRSGVTVKRTANKSLAEVIAHQCNLDWATEEAVIRSEINGASITEFYSRQRVA